MGMAADRVRRCTVPIGDYWRSIALVSQNGVREMNDSANMTDKAIFHGIVGRS
jgi:hypothetical protein